MSANPMDVAATGAMFARVSTFRRTARENALREPEPEPEPEAYDHGLDEGPQKGKAYPAGAYYPRHHGPHPYDSADTPLSRRQKRDARCPHGGEPSILGFLRMRNPNFSGGTYGGSKDGGGNALAAEARTRPLGKGDFLKDPGPYRLAWQSATPDATNGKKMKKLLKALAQSQGDLSKPMTREDGRTYCWREVREVLEVADARADARPQTKADPSHSPLHKHCWRGDEKAASRLLRGTHVSLRKGLATKANANGHTPLHLVCDGSRPFFGGATGRCEIARRLLEAGADVNALDHRHQTPLHKACAQGDNLLAVLLIGAGADELVFDRHGKLATQSGKQPMHPAASESVAAAVQRAIGEPRAKVLRLRETASALVEKSARSAVVRVPRKLPFAHQLFRAKRFPRAKSSDPSRASLDAKKDKYAAEKTVLKKAEGF